MFLLISLVQEPGTSVSLWLWPPGNPIAFLCLICEYSAIFTWGPVGVPRCVRQLVPVVQGSHPQHLTLVLDHSLLWGGCLFGALYGVELHPWPRPTEC